MMKSEYLLQINSMNKKKLEIMSSMHFLEIKKIKKKLLQINLYVKLIPHKMLIPHLLIHLKINKVILVLKQKILLILHGVDLHGVMMIKRKITLGAIIPALNQ